MSSSLICANHQNLLQASKKGLFRSDLYYRINDLTVHLPALRERTDLMALTHQLLDKYSSSTTLSIASDLMLAFQKYSWLGNLRRYNILLRSGYAMLESNETEINWQHLPDDMLELLKLNHPEDERNYIYQQKFPSPGQKVRPP